MLRCHFDTDVEYQNASDIIFATRKLMPTNSAQQPINRLTRSTWLILAAGGAMSATLSVPALFFRDQFKGDDALTVATLRGLFGAVLTLWSVVLALRALVSGERSFGP